MENQLERSGQAIVHLQEKIQALKEEVDSLLEKNLNVINNWKNKK